ncbi:hypothetical protein CERZMDRAFT_85396 [Cercospora zeae-maydis SCOH1-5]|uniref:Extracellular membrane protein CFEM domain-containing protein n=1 Tax=Cercospora zeae-maydis SCOH1-5 TaxID=717836 RepID=A0A6A6FCS0_9PEZI|nr:hypothetical protein CERZMDRAFT_85396 [Cercospora zeae-maydis SCOH1-5]
MKNIVMLVATLLAAVIPVALASGNCWDQDCSDGGYLTNAACSCDYNWEHGNDGTCTSDGNNIGTKQALLPPIDCSLGLVRMKSKLHPSRIHLGPEHGFSKWLNVDRREAKVLPRSL